MSNQAAQTQQQAMEAEFGRPAAPGMKLVRNLMSKKVIEIEADTPGYCDPSRESYWCM